MIRQDKTVNAQPAWLVLNRDWPGELPGADGQGQGQLLELGVYLVCLGEDLSLQAMAALRGFFLLGLEADVYPLSVCCLDWQELNICINRLQRQAGIQICETNADGRLRVGLAKLSRLKLHSGIGKCEAG